MEIALRRGCSPVKLLHIFRTPFPRNTSGWLLLKATKLKNSRLVIIPKSSKSLHFHLLITFPEAVDIDLEDFRPSISDWKTLGAHGLRQTYILLNISRKVLKMEFQLFKWIGHPKVLHKLAQLKILEHYLEENFVEVPFLLEKDCDKNFSFQISGILWASVFENLITQRLIKINRYRNRRGRFFHWAHILCMKIVVDLLTGK